ncbi:cGMP-inhibited 3',5'-cyclic phosphodiesterase A-like isoform X2 [Mizuhopecten yessoensis]|uniref:cGMP-inhibited 3',5'-cyclic phosphodiesterase A-like isoform X2 n=1 Tax=Mizuhopecten yessoensis TaxID=6573 RepID=UPI000B45E4F1|nr:cGMP-inhibited 3',5'-cyclic phosphodiesterase A-like isoform X2 [Mizuhopecten yessoensis]
MALHRSSMSSRRGSKNDSQKDDDEPDNNGYIQILVKPLEQGHFNLVLNWFGIHNYSTQQVGAAYGIVVLLGSVLFYQLVKCDLGSYFQRLCGVLVPMFTIMCCFYWLSLYLRQSWNTTSIYFLFSSCFVGETIAQILISSWFGGTGSSPPQDSGGGGETPSSSPATQPLVVFIVLFSVCTASVFSSLETIHSVVVITLVSFTRFLACSALGELPQTLRPYLAYICGLLGIIISKYMETILKPPINNFVTHDGKISVIKRRRSSSSSAHAFSAHRSARRTSLPALIPKSQCSSNSFEAAILGEAHGLITDMLADVSLPPNVISGLRTLGNLLRPAESHSSFHKPRVSPLVSLTESTSYSSDNEESPYTGERPNMLPKKMRRSLPPSLIRRMSTSTWTTTTSATGMPTLELEPCRIRSSSFRHSRDGTPASSPVGSRSNSPSPSSPTVILTIPKSRSFSLASPSPAGSSHSKRFSRKSMASSVQGLESFTGRGDSLSSSSSLSSSKHISSYSTSTTKEDSDLSPSAMDEGDRSKLPLFKEQQMTSLRRLNITSDYESNDSPSSSDHSDSVLTSDDLVSGSPPKRPVYNRGSSSSQAASQFRRVVHDTHIADELGVDTAEDADEEDVDDHEPDEIPSVVPEVKKDISHVPVLPSLIDGEDRTDSAECACNEHLPYDVNTIDQCELLHIHKLNEWDYPIFDLSDKYHDTILSRMIYKLFMDVGLFETFRIPVAPFLHFFHELEIGYREKPYHNRIHASDVLHGVYYLSTQPIPGFTQLHTTDMFSRNGSSSESESDCVEKMIHKAGSFMAEDSYGIMGGNFPALELMALYTAAAMHDYNHPGRTNAFLVATHAKQAILYNDRSVLENYHAAAAWQLLLSKQHNNYLSGLDQAEFKRFRFLVIELILATDLKRHFEILAEFNAKLHISGCGGQCLTRVNDEESSTGIDWSVETERLLVMQMVIKLADINGPAKTKHLHRQWTYRIAEEFYEQGDEEVNLGMPISPYMDRKMPQLAKLQQTFINHLVAPLCNAMVTGGLLPGTWVEDEDSDAETSEQSDTDKADSTCKDTEDENETDQDTGSPVLLKFDKKPRKVNCLLTKNMKENYEYWIGVMKQEEQQKMNSETTTETVQQDNGSEMEPIKEETESAASANSSPGAPGTPSKEPAAQPENTDNASEEK